MVGIVTALVELPTLIGAYYALSRETDELYGSFPDKYTLIEAKLWGGNLKSSVEDLFSFISGKMTDEEEEYSSAGDVFSDSELDSILLELLNRFGDAYGNYVKSTSLKNDRKSALEKRNNCFLHFSLLLLASSSILAVFFLLGETVFIILCGSTILTLILLLRFMLAWRKANIEKEADRRLHDLTSSFQPEGDRD